MSKRFVRKALFSLALFAVCGLAGASEIEGHHALKGPIAVAWTAEFDIPNSEKSDANAIAVSPDGQIVYLTGSSQKADSREGLTIAYATQNGNKIWTAIGPDDTYYALDVSPERDFVVAKGWNSCVAHDSLTGEDVWRVSGACTEVSPQGDAFFRVSETSVVRRLDSRTGAVIWTDSMSCRTNPSYGGPPAACADVGCWDFGTSALTSDGLRLVLAGRYVYLFECYDIWPPMMKVYETQYTRVLDASSGQVVWQDFNGFDQIVYGHSVRRVIAREKRFFVYKIERALDYYSHTITAFEDDHSVWFKRLWSDANSRGVAASSDASVILSVCADYPRDEAKAIDGETGSTMWVSPLALSPSAWAMHVDDEMVCVAGSSYNPTRLAQGLATESGESLWQTGFTSSDGRVARGNEIAATESQVFVAATLRKGKDPGEARRELLIAYWLVLPIDINIRPQLDPNVVDPTLPGVVPVALLGDEDFDVTTIDPESLRFGPAQAEPCGFMPVRDLDPDAEYAYLLPDVNGDGYDDLIVQFDVQQSGIQCGDTEARLTGELQTGRPFEGADEVVTVGCD